MFFLVVFLGVFFWVFFFLFSWMFFFWCFFGCFFPKIKKTPSWLPLRQPDLVLHVLRLVLHVLCSSRFRVPPLPTSYRLPAKREALVVKWKWKWKVKSESESKSESEKWKWSKIGPLFFLKLIYIIYHVYTNNPICIKMCNQLSYGFKSLQTFGEPTKKNQIHHF